MYTVAEETRGGKQKRSRTVEIAVFGTIKHDGRRNIAARI